VACAEPVLTLALARMGCLPIYADRIQGACAAALLLAYPLPCKTGFDFALSSGWFDAAWSTE